MIIRRTEATAEHAEHESFGVTDTVRLSALGGLTQYGAYLQTLQPGARTSNKHWHENEDEMLYVLSGHARRSCIPAMPRAGRPGRRSGTTHRTSPTRRAPF